MLTMRRRRSIRRNRRPVMYANPPRRERSASVRRSRHHSPAMRAKISRAVKAAMRRRSSGGGHGMAVARRSRRSRRSITHHTYRSPARRSNRIVMGRLLNPRGRRRHFRRRRNPSGLMGGFRNLIGKETVILAAGAVTASIGTGWVINRFGASLPFATNKWAQAGYQVAIPVAAAYVIRRYSPAFAKGLVLGGVIMGITAIMKNTMAGSSIVQGPMGNFYEVHGMGLAGEIGRSRMRGMSAYIGKPGSRTFNTIPQAVNTPVFQGGAWG